MIILSILKFIGIVLLVVLAVFFLLLCLVLFNPIHYQMEGEVHKSDVLISMRASWVFRILGLAIDYSNGQTDSYLRILFFKKAFSDKEEKERKRKAKENKKENENEKNEVSFGEDTISESVFYIDSNEENMDKAEDTVDFQEKEILVDPADKTSGNKDVQRKSKKKRINPDFFENFQRKKDKVVSKVKEIGKIKDNTTNFFEDPHNKRAIQHIKNEVLYLLKILCPRKMKLELEFSLGDPAYTGIILGILAMFPIGYNNRWQVQPDFESDQAYADGVFDIKGSLFVYQILFIVFRLVIDKECRRMYNKYKK